MTGDRLQIIILYANEVKLSLQWDQNLTLNAQRPN